MALAYGRCQFQGKTRVHEIDDNEGWLNDILKSDHDVHWKERRLDSIADASDKAEIWGRAWSTTDSGQPKSRPHRRRASAWEADGSILKTDVVA